MLLKECEEEKRYMSARISKLAKKIASLKSASPGQVPGAPSPSKTRRDSEASSARKTSNPLFDDQEAVELPSRFAGQAEGFAARHTLRNNFETIPEKEEESQTMSPTKQSGVEVNSHHHYGRDSPLVSQFEAHSSKKPHTRSALRPELSVPNKSLVASIRLHSQLNKSSRTVSKHREETDKSYRISTSIQVADSPSKQSRQSSQAYDYKILLPNKSKLDSSEQKSRWTKSPFDDNPRQSKPWPKVDGLEQLVYRRPETTLDEVKTLQAKRRNVEVTVRRALVREVKQTRDRQLLYRSKMQRIIRMNHLADYNDESHVNGMSLLPRF